MTSEDLPARGPARPTTRVAILGCGLMGTSIAMAAVRRGDSVTGFDEDPERLAQGARLGGFSPAESVHDCAGGADLVFICTPTASIPRLAVEALGATPHGTITDVGSVKSRVVDEVEMAAPAEARGRFVGGHPMAGSERSGPEWASAALLEGAVWVLTPIRTTGAESLGAVEAWVGSVGARPVRMDPTRHDRAVAVVSHLPQIVSASLMSFAAREEEGHGDNLLLAAGGFRDLTRLAASKPDLWADILISNTHELADALDGFAEALEEIKGLLLARDAEGLTRTLAMATEARLALAAKPHVRSGVALIQVLVPDRPGVLAELTIALGELGVNIEDLQIVHSPEGGGGVVHITVAAGESEPASAALTEHGFRPVRLA